MNLCRIFIASSANLKTERDEFRKDFNPKTTFYYNKGVKLELVIWEDMDPAIHPHRKQDDYNSKLEECDILVLIYWGELGKFSDEEYRLALDLLRKKNKPRIYIYKKDVALPEGYIPDERNVSNLKRLEQELALEGNKQWPFPFDHYNTLLKNFWDNVLALFEDPTITGFSYDTTFLNKVVYYNNLKHITDLFGREQEIKQISACLAGENIGLVTLFGPGGTGKSMLANLAGLRNIHKFVNGAIFVELAPLGTEGSVVGKIINTLSDIKLEFSKDPEKQLVDFLKDQKLIIILDNCEYLVDQCKSVISKIVAACPGIKVIATTQIAFHIQCEKIIHVKPLQKPMEDMSLSVLKDNPCVQLFLHHAKNVQEQFKISERTRKDVVDICNYRDGIPLAIILAASALKMKSLEYINKSIKKSLEVAGEAFTDGVAHHQTVEMAIEWSYNLLNNEQKEVFIQLAVFKDDFTEEAASFVCGVEDHFDKDFEKLVDSSIISSSSGFIQSRTFFILEPIRLFGENRLNKSGSAEETKKRFITFYTNLTSEFLHLYFTRELSRQLKLIEEQYDNISHAIHLARESKDWQTAAIVCSYLWRYWEVRARYDEGIEQIKVTLQQKIDDPATYLELLHGIGMLYYRGGKIDIAETYFKQHLEAAKACADPVISQLNIAHAMNNLGNPKALYEFDDAIDIYGTAYEIFKQLDDRRMIAVMQNNLGNAYSNRGDLPKALDYYLSSARSFEEADNLWESGYPIYGVGTIYFQFGNFDEAVKAFQLAYERRKDAEDKRNMGRCQNILALIDLKGQYIKEAYKKIEIALRLLYETKDPLSLRELHLTIIQYCFLIHFQKMAVMLFSFINLKYGDKRFRKKYLEDPAMECITIIKNSIDAATFAEWELLGKKLEEGEILIKIKQFNRTKSK